MIQKFQGNMIKMFQTIKNFILNFKISSDNIMIFLIITAIMLAHYGTYYTTLPKTTCSCNINKPSNAPPDMKKSFVHYLKFMTGLWLVFIVIFIPFYESLIDLD
jgi:hypothetical protein